ncbi:MAG: hypothetical protein CMI90_07065 [Pelagibacteraceae bacterium]|nr:hypothetical protein [Pelagibacteraceae bacterium]
MRKIAFISSSIELKFLKKKYKSLNDFLIITLDPSIVKKDIFTLEKFIGEKKLLHLDNHKFRIIYSNFLKKIDKEINSYFNKNYNFYLNSIHQQTKFVIYAKNYHLFLKKIQKLNPDTFIYFNYYEKNKKITNHEISILDLILKYFNNKKIKVETIKANNSFFLKGCFEKDIFQYHFEDFNLKRKLYSFASNLKQELFRSHKKSLCLMNMDRQQLKFFYKNYSDSYNLILFNNYVKTNKNQNIPISKTKFFQILTKIEDRKFFQSIGCDNWFYKVLIENYFDILNNFYFRFNFAEKSFHKLNKKFNFTKYIYGVELPIANYINSLFNEKKTKSLALSHGGTIGHYKDWPYVFFYLIKNKYSYYQIFSNKIKNSLLRTFRLYKNSYFKNLFVVPSFSLIKLKESSFYKNNQKYSKEIKKVCYICSKNFHIHDLKKKEHTNENLLKLRLKMIEIFKKNPNINFIIKNYPNENFLFNKNNVFSKNITYISNGVVKEINHGFDLFILESESTSLVEISCLNKKVVCLQRKHPKILKSNYNQFKKSVSFSKKSDTFLKTIKHLLKLKKLKKFSKCSFANDYYNIDDINQLEFKKSLTNFINT